MYCKLRINCNRGSIVSNVSIVSIVIVVSEVRCVSNVLLFVKKKVENQHKLSPHMTYIPEAKLSQVH